MYPGNRLRDLFRGYMPTKVKPPISGRQYSSIGERISGDSHWFFCFAAARVFLVDLKTERTLAAVLGVEPPTVAKSDPRATYCHTVFCLV
jgi:hypothetical protein